MVPKDIKFVLSWITMTSRFKTLSGCIRTQKHGRHDTSTNRHWFTVSDTGNIIRSVARFRPEYSHTHTFMSVTHPPSFWNSGMIYSSPPRPPTSTEPSPHYRCHRPNTARHSLPAHSNNHSTVAAATCYAVTHIALFSSYISALTENDCTPTVVIIYRYGFLIGYLQMPRQWRSD
jgi:hypothetical protein